MRKLLVLFAIAVVAFGAVACSEDEPTVGADATDDTSDIYAEGSPGVSAGEDTIDAQVSIVDFAYEPNSFNATAGEEVRWQNTGENNHNVTLEGGLATPILRPGDDFKHTFEDAGEFTYFCSVHGKDRMSGTIIVE